MSEPLSGVECEIECFETYEAGFEFAPMVGLVIRPGEDQPGEVKAWLAWDEVVALTAWLTKMVAAANPR